MTLRLRHNVTLRGPEDAPVMLFAHGFGCDQSMWRFVAPAFEATHRVVLFDHAGCGGADPAAYDVTRHGSLEGYAEDVVAICADLEHRSVRKGDHFGHLRTGDRQEGGHRDRLVRVDRLRTARGGSDERTAMDPVE